MIRPLEHQDRSYGGEYINRIRETESGHSATSRDFANEIREVSKDGGKKHPSEHEFGEDTYEASEEESSASETPKKPQHPAEQPDDDSNLDITV
jgi:hypothetical protein